MFLLLLYQIINFTCVEFLSIFNYVKEVLRNEKVFMLLFVMILAFIMFAEDFVVADWLTPEKPKMGGEVNLALSGAPDSFNLYGTFYACV